MDDQSGSTLSTSDEASLERIVLKVSRRLIASSIFPSAPKLQREIKGCHAAQLMRHRRNLEASGELVIPEDLGSRIARIREGKRRTAEAGNLSPIKTRIMVRREHIRKTAVSLIEGRLYPSASEISNLLKIQEGTVADDMKYLKDTGQLIIPPDLKPQRRYYIRKATPEIRLDRPKLASKTLPDSWRDHQRFDTETMVRTYRRAWRRLKRPLKQREDPDERETA